MNTSVFFAKAGEKGLNLTSCTKLANLANNIIVKNDSVLNKMHFVNEAISIIGCKDNLPAKLGMSESVLATIPELIVKNGELKAFLAYLGEARKAYTELQQTVKNYTQEEYTQITGNTKKTFQPQELLPMRPVDKETVKNELLTLKERAEYLALEAKAAQLGKLIHNDGTLTKARMDVLDAVTNPTKIAGNGRDTVCTYYTPSVQIQNIEALYNSLQQCYNNTESSLNRLKKKIEDEIVVRQLENEEIQQKNIKITSENQRISSELRALFASEFQTWKTEQMKKASETKIAIPNCYLDLYKELYN